MKEIIQSAFDLHYFLIKFKDNNKKEKISKNLTILQEKEIVFGDKKITLAIIGESHFLMWNNFMELFSCVPIKGDNESFDVLLNLSGRALDKTKLSCDDEMSNVGGRYEIKFNFRKIVESTQKKIKVLNNLYIHNKNQGYYFLKQKFPGEGYPSTYLWAKVSRGSINLKTCHTYPNENMTVWTNSKFKIK